MHVNTSRLSAPGTRRAEPRNGADPDAVRVSPTSVLLVLAALVGVVVTFLFGLWMIGFAQHSAGHPADGTTVSVPAG